MSRIGHFDDFVLFNAWNARRIELTLVLIAAQGHHARHQRLDILLVQLAAPAETALDQSGGAGGLNSVIKKLLSKYFWIFDY